MKPWKIQTKESKTVDLIFEPFFERIADTNLILLRTKVNQMIGRYSGNIIVDGISIPISNAIGWAEDHIARW